MRRIVIFTFLALLQYPRLAEAQFGGVTVCANCATEPTAIAMHSEQVLQYIRQAQQLQQEIRQVQMMVQEGKALAHSPGTTIINDLNSLSSILVSSQGLAGSMAQIDATFRKIYTPYAIATPANYGRAYNSWANTAMRSLEATLKAAGYQGGMLQNEQTWMRQVQAMNQMPFGRDESLQLGNSIATQEVAELQALRQLMLSDMQSKDSYVATEVNREQAAEAASENALSHTDRGADGTGY